MAFEAFNIVSVVDNIELVGESNLGKISALVCDSSDLYVGTINGHVLRFQFSVDHTANAFSTLLTSRHICNAEIAFLQTASAMERLLILADDCLVGVESTSLTTVAAAGDRGQQQRLLRGVCAVAPNVNPPPSADPFAVQVCVARRSGALAVLQLGGNGVWRCLCQLDTSQCKVTSSSATAAAGGGSGGGGASGAVSRHALVFSGHVVCVALAASYWVFDVRTQRPQHVLDVPPDVQRPLAAVLNQDEFIVLGPASLVLFATANGTSQRPPLALSCAPHSLAVHAHHLVYTDRATLHYVNVLDESCCGRLSLPEVDVVASCDGRLLVTTMSSVLAMCPASAAQQQQLLLDAGNYDALAGLLRRGQLQLSQLPAAAAMLLSVKLVAAGDSDRALELLTGAQVTAEQVAALYSRDETEPVETSAELSEALSAAGADALLMLVTEYLLATAQPSHSQSVCEKACVLLAHGRRDIGAAHRYVLAVGRGVPALQQQPLLRVRLLLLQPGDAAEQEAVQLCRSVIDEARADVLPLLTAVANSTASGAIFRQCATLLLLHSLPCATGVFVALARATARRDRLLPVHDSLTLLQSYPSVQEQYLSELITVQTDLPAMIGTQLCQLYLNGIECGSSGAVSGAAAAAAGAGAAGGGGDAAGVTSDNTAADTAAAAAGAPDTVAADAAAAADTAAGGGGANRDAHKRLLELVRCDSGVQLVCDPLLNRATALHLRSVAAHLHARMGQYRQSIELLTAPDHTAIGRQDTDINAHSAPYTPAITLERVQEAIEFIDIVAPSIVGKFIFAQSETDRLRSRLYGLLVDICLRHAKTDATCALHVLNQCAGVQDCDNVCAILQQLPAGWSLAALQPFLTALRRRLAHQLSLGRQLHALASCGQLSEQLQLSLCRTTAVHIRTDSRCAVCNAGFTVDSVTLCRADSFSTPGGSHLMLVHRRCVPPTSTTTTTSSSHTPLLS